MDKDDWARSPMGGSKIATVGGGCFCRAPPVICSHLFAFGSSLIKKHVEILGCLVFRCG